MILNSFLIHFLLIRFFFFFLSVDLGFFFLLTVWEVFMPEIDLGLQILNFHFGLSKNQNKDMDLDGSI